LLIASDEVEVWIQKEQTDIVLMIWGQTRTIATLVHNQTDAQEGETESAASGSEGETEDDRTSKVTGPRARAQTKEEG